MPLERFFRLPEEKKECIMYAAIAEFARVPFEKASINKIIQDASISRGSFYTYFVDKDDLACYVLKETEIAILEYMKKILTEGQGDFFQLWIRMFNEMIEYIQESKDMMKVVHNVMLYQAGMRMTAPQNSTRTFFDFKEQLLRESILENVNFSDWARKDSLEIKSVFSIAGVSLVEAFMKYCNAPESLEEITQLYQHKLLILKIGVSNTSEE